MNCCHCKSKCIKKGVRKGIQKYQCKLCKVYQQEIYKYQKYNPTYDLLIKNLNNEGMSISSISRITSIAKTNVLRRLFFLSKQIEKPIIKEQQQEYEVDEMQTYVQKKQPSNYVYITYAINKKTRQVIDFIVGRRTKENLAKVINCLLLLNPVKIYTDKLNIYPSLINRNIHSCKRHLTNRIERMNLTIRTHLKRLSRSTICFSKSIFMLEASLKLYFIR